jgi:hypothetical protein
MGRDAARRVSDPAATAVVGRAAAPEQTSESPQRVRGLDHVILGTHQGRFGLLSYRGTSHIL